MPHNFLVIGIRLNQRRSAPRLVCVNLMEPGGQLVNEKNGRSGPMCSACEMAVMWVQNQLNQNKTQAQILDYINELCERLPSPMGESAVDCTSLSSMPSVPANSTTGESLGVSVLKARSIFLDAYWYWLGVGALVGFIFLYNALFTVVLTIFDPFGKSQAVVSEEILKEKHANRTREIVQSAITYE